MQEEYVPVKDRQRRLYLGALQFFRALAETLLKIIGRKIVEQGNAYLSKKLYFRP